VMSMLVSALSALVLVPALVLAFPPRFLRGSVVGAADPVRPLPNNAKQALLLVMLVLGAMVAGDAWAQNNAPTATEWMERNHQTTRVNSSLSTAKFVLISPGGQERVRETFSATRLQPDGVHNRRVVRFLSPSDVRNTTTLIVENAGKDDDIWIYLPALKKTRRIASDNKKASFVGSDLSYADMVGHRPAEWTHTLLRQETVAGQRTQVIESVPKSPETATNTGYSKRISWIAESHAVALKVEFFDTHGQALKTLENSDVQVVDAARKKHQAMNVRVKNLQTGHQTLVVVHKFDTQTPVGDDYFSTGHIEKEE
jgi:uncharacterized protein